MRRRTIELGLGMGLLLGPLAYALTLEPEVIEVTRVVEVPAPSAAVESPTETEDAECSDPDLGDIAAPEIAAPGIAATPIDADDQLRFAFVGEAGLVLTTHARRAWSTGPLLAHEGPAQFRAAKRADLAKVPELHAQQLGRVFDVYGPSGKVCTARLGELSVLAQHDGPSLFEVYNGSSEDIVWDPSEGDADPWEAFDKTTHTEAQTRRKVWSSMGKDGNAPWLVASLVSDTPCAGGLWARDAELPPPDVLHRVDATAVTARRIDAFEHSQMLADAKREYQQWRGELPEDVGSVPKWSEVVRSHPATVDEWADASGVTRMVELEFGDPGEGCGDMSTSLTSVDRVSVDGFEPTQFSVDPIAVFDADLDGRYELLHDAWLSSETAALQLSAEPFAVQYCPC